MTKSEKIISNAINNPTKRNVKILANLALRLLKSRKYSQKRKRQLENTCFDYARRITNHNWDIDTGRKSGSCV